MANTTARRLSDMLTPVLATLSTALSTLVVGLLSLKNLPGLWHVRVLRGIYYQLYFQPGTLRPQDLFKPLITSTTNSIYECDWNCHKSNSTYFSDLDVSRSHLMSCICRGITRLNRGEEQHLLPPNAANSPAPVHLVLAGVAANFHREIEPLQQFEIWSRILAWDARSIYCISHVIKKGTVQPTSYALQPRKKGVPKDGHQVSDALGPTDHIYASSIARYAVRKGTVTLRPEMILELSRLLPPRSSEGEQDRQAEAVSHDYSGDRRQHANAQQAAIGRPDKASRAEHEWCWEDVERERLRGLDIAAHFNALGELHTEFRGGDALGQFGDYW